MRFSVLPKLVFAAAALAALSGCVTDDPDYRDRGPRRQYGGGQVEIPLAYLPPPGACRIWLPDRPPRHQPPPGPCERLRRHVPPGAALVRG